MLKKSISLLLVIAVVFSLFNFTPAATQIFAADTAAYQVAVGEKITITSTKGSRNHSWSSSDTSIATVTVNASNDLIAEVTGVGDKAGTVVITHRYRNYGNSTYYNETFTVTFGDPVDKTVHWVEEGRTAEIVIQSIQTKEATAPTPKVLFLGSLCTSHSLTTSLLAEAINNLAEVADVDYFMYGLKMSDLSSSNYPTEGTVKKGGSITSSTIKGATSQMHIALFYFAEILGSLDLDQYDIIVLEFDGIRMANMGDYSKHTGLTQDNVVTYLNNHYKASSTKGYANPQKNTKSLYSKHYGKTVTWADIEADLAAAAYNLIPQYEAGKVAWLMPKLSTSLSQSTEGGTLIYDDNAFIGSKNTDANMMRGSWDALAIMAPETWLAKDKDGNYLKKKATQPTTVEGVKDALFKEGTTYYTRANDKFSNGEGLWTTYDQSETISELLDAKTYDLIHYENVNIQDYIANGFKVTGVRGEYLNETVNPPVWTEVSTASGNFSYTVEGDYVDAKFNLKALKSEKTRVIIDIETTEEIVYEEVSGEMVVATNKGQVKVIYDGDDENPVVDDPPVLPEPSVDITKISNPGNGETAFVGNDISYIFKVENIGSVDITKVVVTDPTLIVGGKGFTYTYSQTLAPGKTLVIIGQNDTYTPATGETVVKTTIPKHTVTAADLTNGSVDNEAFVEVTLKGGSKSYDESDISNPVKEKAFNIKKESSYEGKASGALPDIGTTITYTVTVKNISSRTIENVIVKDSLVGAEAVTNTAYVIDEKDATKVTIPSLNAGATATVNYTYKVTEQDVLLYSRDSLPLINYATVSAEDESSETGSCSDNLETLKVDVNVEKVWEDNNDQDGKRPSSIEVQLKKKVGNAQEVNVTGQKKSITSNDSWKTTFTGLPKFENGVEVVYSVVETETNVITGVDGAGTYKIGYSSTQANSLIVTNTHTPEKTSVSVSKVWDDNNDQDGKRPDSVTVQLCTVGSDKKLNPILGKTIKLTAKDDWKGSFTDLDKYSGTKLVEYAIMEKLEGSISVFDGPETYKSEVTGNMNDGFVITNKHTPTKISVSVEKEWNDDNNRDGIRPESVEIQLYKKVGTGQETAVAGKKITLDSTSNWKGTFADLPEFEGGKTISYTVKETTTKVITGTDGAGTYAIEITGDMTEGFKVKNTHTPELVSVKVTKKWTDGNNQDGIRPNGVDVALTYYSTSILDAVTDLTKKVTLNATNSWTHTYENLFKYSNGTIITYGVSEFKTDVITGDDKSGEYSISITSKATNDFEIENIHTPETFDTTVTIDWDDNDDQDGIRPESVEVKLYKKVGDAQETLVDGKTFTITGDDWTVDLEDLPKYEGGVEITYIVKETTTDVLKNVDGAGTYSIDVVGGSSNGFTIENLHTPEKVSYNVSKVWEDNSDQDGIRPESVEVKLYKKVGSGNETFVEGKVLELSETNSWKGSFTDLDKYEGGVEIVYSVKETATKVITDTDGEKTYKSKVEFKTDDGFIVTNTHTPSVFDFTVKAEWDDADNQDGIRPDTVVVQLYKKVGDGAETKVNDATLTLTKDGGFTDKFEDLPKYEGGKLVTYTVKEVTTGVLTGTDKAGEYKIEVKDSSAMSTTFKNVHTPETVNISVEKVWEDADNQDGIRPTSVEIKLIKSVNSSTPAVVSGKVLTLSANNSWKDTFADLPKYENGYEISYTIVETTTEVITDSDTDDTYKASIDDAESGFKVTNTHTPAVVDVYVCKEWNDGDNQDGIRPESVEITLYKKVGDGEPSVVTTTTLDEDNDWEYTFEDLDKFEGGVLIQYTVAETLTAVITGEDTDTTYEYTVTGDQTEGYKVTNKHTPATVDIKGYKTWDDAEYVGKDGYTRPSEITLHFYGKTDGEPFKAHDDIVLTAANADKDNENQWNFEIVNLPKFKDGIEIEYSVTETSVDGFKEAEIEDFNVTNTPKDKTENVTETSITIKKEDGLTDTGFGLKGANFKLEKNIGGEFFIANGLFVTDENGELKITFTDEGTYRLTEIEAPAGYELSDPAPYFDIVVAKEFVNVEFDSENDVWVWNYKLVADKTVNDYLDDDNAVVLKNNPKTIDVSVSKVWNDADNQDGFRAEAVKVQLLKSVDGGDFEVVEDSVKTLDESNGWNAVYENLVKFQDAKEIVYKVNEIFEGNVTGEDAAGTYGVAIAGDEATGFVITNTHTAETTEIEINVVWEDENNKYNDRPEQITVTIYQEVDGVVTKVMDVVITGGITDDFWTKAISNLPVYSDGHKIKYILDSEILDIPVDYENTLDGFTITSVHTIPRPTGDESIAVWCILMCAAVALLSIGKDDKRFKIKL